MMGFDVDCVLFGVNRRVGVVVVVCVAAFFVEVGVTTLR
jgi:hypothetical protein